MEKKEQQKPQEFAITFDEPRIVKEIPAVKQTVSKIVIREMVDNPVMRRVTVRTNIGDIILWDKEAYDRIGDWTNRNIQERINELYPIQGERKSKEK